MGLFIYFFKYLSLVGALYFSVLASLCYIEFEPLKIKKELYESNAYGAIIASALNIIVFLILFCKISHNESKIKSTKIENKINLLSRSSTSSDKIDSASINNMREPLIG